MKESKKILAFAREVGGASAIAPVCQAMLQENWELLFLAKDKGLDFLKNQNLDCIDFPSFDVDHLNRLIDRKFQSSPNLIFTSATSLPTLDMTERYLWKWGRENEILTVGVLDQWQNYGLRFSGPGSNERLAYLPDYILVMDELAKDEMIKEGIPEELIVITGQPAFDKIIEEHKILSSQINKIKNKLQISDNFTVITFVAESLKKDFGDRLGYDEQSTLGFLGDVLDEICERNKDLQIYFIIKLHPENKYEEFEWALSRWSSLKKQIIEKELSSCEVIEISDLVVGMTSIMLVEAILVSKITVSLQINSLVDSQLVATKTGAVPFIKDKKIGRQILNSLLLDEKSRKSYLQKELNWKIKTNGTQRCLEMLKRIE